MGGLGGKKGRVRGKGNRKREKEREDRTMKIYEESVREQGGRKRERKGVRK